MYRCLIFHPNGDIETYVGIVRPKPDNYSEGTWRLNRESGIETIDRWCVIKTIQDDTDWQYSYVGDEDSSGVPKEYKMLALVHP